MFRSGQRRRRWLIQALQIRSPLDRAGTSKPDVRVRRLIVLMRNRRLRVIEVKQVSDPSAKWHYRKWGIECGAGLSDWPCGTPNLCGQEVTGNATVASRASTPRRGVHTHRIAARRRAVAAVHRRKPPPPEAALQAANLSEEPGDSLTGLEHDETSISPHRFQLD